MLLTLMWLVALWRRILIQIHYGFFRCAHFAIYDGHGGRQAADFARAHLHANIVSCGLGRELETSSEKVLSICICIY